MTSRQYEHLGRALAAEALLEEESERLDDLREELHKHLSALVPYESSGKWITERYGKQMATWHNGREFMNAVRDIIKNENKKESAK